MKKLVVVIGPRRSGLHAVCNWLIGHFPGHVRFLNDPPIEKSPHLENFVVRFDYDVGADKIRLIPTLHFIKVHARLLNISVATKLPWPWRNIAVRILRNIWSPRIMDTTCAVPVFDDAEASDPDTHLLLFENLTPFEAAKFLPSWLAAYRKQFGLPLVDKEKILIVLRSPWNCLASTLRHPSMGSKNSPSLRRWFRKHISNGAAVDANRTIKPDQIGELWASYAREIIGETRHLTSQSWQIQPVLYDLWRTTPELRASIASGFGRPLDDRGLARTATYGGGSSFEGQRPMAADAQALTNRWKHYRDHSAMQALLRSSEIHRLAAALRMSTPPAD